MAISSITCLPPVRRSHRNRPPDFALLHRAVELFDEGEHLASVTAILDHLLGGQPVPDLTAETLTFVQGSSHVSVRVDDGIVRIWVPLVRIGQATSTTAALRFLLSRVSATGQLYQPRLHGDEVHIEFADRLSRAHPHKLREVLRQMPFEADAHDDWMVHEFHCEPIARESLEPLSDDELSQADLIWRTHWHEVDELLKACHRKRSVFFLNEVSAFALHHLLQALPITGYHWSRITAASDTFNDTSIDPSTREAALAKCVREMRAVEGEALRRSLGHASYALAPQADGNLEVLEGYLGPEDYLDTILRYYNRGHYMEAGVGLISTYAFLLARYCWPEPVTLALQEGLAAASGRAFREAAASLLKHNRAVLELGSEIFGSDDDDDDHDGDGDADGENADATEEVQS